MTFVKSRMRENRTYGSVRGSSDFYSHGSFLLDKYKIPKQERGKYLDDYKYIDNPKTVYNPKMYSDDDMYKWGLEAMESGYLNGNTVCGEASNGMKFMGYYINGEVTSFFPVLSFE